MPSKSGATTAARRSRSSGRQHHGGRERRRCSRAFALGALGEQLGVALVQAGDGVAEVVGGEDLDAARPAR